MPRQDELFDADVPERSGVVPVNDRVSFRTEGTHRVISVHGIVAAHYDLSDRAAEAFAMVTLFESGYADQNEIARAFGYSCRSLRRYQERLEVGGVHALGRARGRPCVITPSGPSARDRTILQLKARGLSNRAIAQRLGVVEYAIRKRLHRLHWTTATVEAPSLLDPPDARPPITAQPALPLRQAPGIPDTSVARLEAFGITLDADPGDRSMDRLLAAMGRLEDARPLFAATERLPGAGVLLAVPALVASGVLTAAQQIYGSLGPAFYGLRTTVVAYILLALLRIARPEMLKEHAPGDLGRIVGLDRIPEVKTLRRKLAQLAAKGGAQALGREMARRRIVERGRILGFLYVDGHVRAYHGGRRIAKAYLTRARITGPATTDYWVNDKRGDPLFVVTADANAKMTRMLVPIFKQLRPLFAGKRRLTVVFDRGGWSPELFQQIVGLGLDLLTYRKGRVRRVATKRFLERRARLDGRRVTYLLHDQAVRFLKGKLRLRQVTRLTPETGHQTPIVTSRWDLRDIVVAYRMFERWRQENFFKYMRQEYLIDALTDYGVEPDDPDRSVPNPARKAVDKELHQARGQLARLRESYGTAALEYIDGRTPTMAAFTEAEQRLQSELDKVQTRIARLAERQKTLPVRIPLRETPHAAQAMKLSTERKHLTNVLKMVAYQIESTLVEQLRPYYARTDDEGRTLIQSALRGCAALEPTADELRVTVVPLSSPHRSTALRLLCDDLNKTATPFPGTTLRLRFAVAQSASS
jgi:transposase